MTQIQTWIAPVLLALTSLFTCSQLQIHNGGDGDDEDGGNNDNDGGDNHVDDNNQFGLHLCFHLSSLDISL